MDKDEDRQFVPRTGPAWPHHIQMEAVLRDVGDIAQRDWRCETGTKLLGARRAARSCVDGAAQGMDIWAWWFEAVLTAGIPAIGEVEECFDAIATEALVGDIGRSIDDSRRRCREDTALKQ